jgi:hypothetical protein
MVAGMALDPRDIVNDIQRRPLGADGSTLDAKAESTGTTGGEAPLLLSRPVRSRPPLTPLRDEPTVAAMHEAWSSAHTAGQNRGEQARSLRTRVESAVSTVTGPGQRQDRAVIAGVIQAVDAVARRCDELAGRVAELEAVIGEVVDVLGADLVRVRAELARRSAASSVGENKDPPTGDGESRRLVG